MPIFYETICYFKDPQRCNAEVKRIIRENGTVIICTVNKDWEDFHPSPYTYRYFSAPELYQLIKQSFREVKLFGGFLTNTLGLQSKIISMIKRSAVRFDLIPGSLKGRAYLKRIFMGKLISLPSEITEGMAPYERSEAEFRGRRLPIHYVFQTRRLNNSVNQMNQINQKPHIPLTTFFSQL